MLVLVEMGVLYWNSGVVEGLNKHADTYKKAAIAEGDIKNVDAGNIYDRNGKCLVENTRKKIVVDGGNEGSQTKEKLVKVSNYLDDFAYTQIIGFIGEPSVQIDEYDVEVVHSGGNYRLMKYYEDTLYHTENVNSTKGNSLVLTLDHELQIKVQEILAKELEATNDGIAYGLNAQGSAIVMDAKTGAIRAMVSFPTLNANNAVESRKVQYDEQYKDLEISYPISYKGAKPSGSVFKIVSSVSIIDHGMEEFTALDNQFMIGSVPIVNDYSDKNDEINYQTAMERSSNVFFSQAALQDNGKALEETAKKFKLGENILLDFGKVNSNWDLNQQDKVEIAYTAFGQGKTLFSTMTAAMVTQAIANDGVMMEPYLIQDVVDAKGNSIGYGMAEGKKVEAGGNRVLSQVTSKETADKVTAAMMDSTTAHLHVVEGESAKEVYKTYKIASKTGTAENGDDSNNAWFVSFAPADDPEYIVVVNQCNTNKYGYRMMDAAAEIYHYLFEESR